ncbi:pirin family protein [Arenimonas fontis]|uniref:Pirin family protein n=1 Tax=Arenimonas fontis TaxID=2608255 RepID=A0A5B2ZEC5_9GAMM|nr:pirin family protein [Arenimonas fontis]KAA2285604.1 pirin family protein [Arenimonas fontis]
MPRLLPPRVHDLGDGFLVKRLLPHASQRSVGPFVFLDHIGPADLGPGQALDVRPHPHIGLATVTFLWEGAILHRDSLGSVQEIRPGDVNWMTAGSGIVHSERTPDRLRGKPQRMHGLQTWVALPREREEAEPAFAHHPAASLPAVDGDGLRLTVVAGRAFGRSSPVQVFSDTLYVSVALKAGARLRIPAEHPERALYPVSGDVTLEDEGLPQERLAVLDADGEPVLTAKTDATVMLLGGEPLDGPRFMWWNFVSSSRERIEQAKADWREGRFGKVPGDDEFIPLPER